MVNDKLKQKHNCVVIMLDIFYLERTCSTSPNLNNGIKYYDYVDDLRFAADDDPVNIKDLTKLESLWII